MQNPAADPDVRSSGLGASDAAAALGVSRWKGPLDLYLEKKGLMPTVGGEESEAMEIGRDIEPWILGRYARKEKYFVAGRDLDGAPVLFTPEGGMLPLESDLFLYKILDTLRSPVDPFRMCHLDGVAFKTWSRRETWRKYGAEQGLHLVEAKSSLSRTALFADEWGEEGTDEVPPEYICQAHHQMDVVRDLFKYEVPVVIPAILAGPRWRTFRVERDPEFAELLLDAERDLWRRIQHTDPPPADINERGKKAMVRLYPRVNVEAREVDEGDRIHSMALMLAQSKAEVKAWKDEELHWTIKIQEEMRDTGKLIGPNWKVSWTETKGRARTDWKAIAERLSLGRPKLYPKLIEQHTTVGEPSRSFRFTPPTITPPKESADVE